MKEKQFQIKLKKFLKKLAKKYKPAMDKHNREIWYGKKSKTEFKGLFE